MFIEDYMADALHEEYGPGISLAFENLIDENGNVISIKPIITSWDEEQTGQPQPSVEQMQDVLQNYIDNVLPIKQAKQSKIDKITAALNNDDFKELLIHCAKWINQQDSSAIPAELKQKVQEALQA